MPSSTRTAVANTLQEMFFNSKKMSPEELDSFLRKRGNHERSRVLELLRSQRGIPITQDGKNCYGISESDLACYRTDRIETLRNWKKEADYARHLRRVDRFLSVMRDIRADISPST